MRELQGSNIQQYTGYKPADLRSSVLLLHDLYMARRGGSLIAVREKYKLHMVRNFIHYSYIEPIV